MATASDAAPPLKEGGTIAGRWLPGPVHVNHQLDMDPSFILDLCSYNGEIRDDADR